MSVKTRWVAIIGSVLGTSLYGQELAGGWQATLREMNGFFADLK